MRVTRSTHIHRQTNGDYQVRWTSEFTDSPVTIYAAVSPEDFDRQAPAMVDAKESALITGLDESERYYFLLVPQSGAKVVVGERLLPLTHGVNFRDFGGYPAADGRRLRWGRFYRSGYMSRLDERDIAYLSALDINTCCDFRSGGEMQKEPSLLPERTEILALSIAPGSMQGYWDLMAEGKASADQMPEMMQQLNVDLVENHADEYGEMLSQLCSLKEGALLVNCSAGKDRTGFGVALIMMALGVPREAILYDYLLSHKYFSRGKEVGRLILKYSEMSDAPVNASVLMPMMEAREEYLASALNHIETNYGTPEAYLSEKFSLTPEDLGRLRERFTY